MRSEDLAKFKSALTMQLEKVERDIEAIMDELEQVATYENIDDIEDLAQLATINDTDKVLLERLVDERKRIKEALRKIETGEYGKCKDGTPIPLEKLQADPLYEC